MGAEQRGEATPPPPDPIELRRRLDFEDAALLAECDVDIYRASGPGGQHRNKVSSAVRLRHRPTGLTVTGTERRSQHENKAKAVGRLREALAIACRAPLPERIEWPANVQPRDGRLRVNEQNPARHAVVALLLDALDAERGQVRSAAERLGLTSSSLTKLLASFPKAWTEANRIRAAHELGPLRAP